MSDIIEVENKFYISVNSTYADDRVRVLNHVDTFGIFDRWGDMKQLGEEVQGIYYNGMRYISELEFRINDQRPLLLSSSVKEENEILSVDLTNPTINIPGTNAHIPKGVLYIGRSKFIRNKACFEQVKLSNYGHAEYEFELSIAFNADFRDIFEVRGIRREQRGEVYEIRHAEDNNVIISYMGLDNVKRCTTVHFSQKPDSWERHNKAVFRICIKPQEQVMLEYDLFFLTGDEDMVHTDYHSARRLVEQEMHELSKISASFHTSNQLFTQWIERSQFDLRSLLARTEHGLYPYAGVPWYNTAFGRDGIITAMQTLWAAPDIARDVLRFLAATQATEEDAYRDAEPGKIVHEIRGGEMVEMKEVPFKQYYGTVDATPLFIMLAGAYYRRTGDRQLIADIWPNIEAALNWIDTYGDIDGDGFVDYHHKSVNGLFNQGWKDSYDSVSHEDGRLAVPPIALCEVQGYVYSAKLKAAMLAGELGHKEKAVQLQHEAEDLKQRFNEQYWDEDLQCFVIALDGNKERCRIVSSNAGQCLFTGIADDDKAEKLVRRLMQEDMFTGWGIRTMSSKEQRYNPMSYHNGSIWPHDVALITIGFARYGFQAQALQLTGALFDASLFIELQRLPELFCGFERRVGEGPTDYPVACSPQAWSVTAVFMLLEACIHVDVVAAERTIYFRRPVLPEGVDTLEVSNLHLGTGLSAHVVLYTKDGAVQLDVKHCPSNWQVVLE
jgi:glycogen debranching enzyme